MLTARQRSSLLTVGAMLGMRVEACGCAPAEPPRAPATTASAAPVTSQRAIAEGAAPMIAAADAGEPPAPTAVDTSLSAPEYAELVATATDGAALLVIHGWRALTPAEVARFNPSATTPRGALSDADAAALAEAQAFGMMSMERGSTTYLAVLDARHACIEETLSFDVLDAASATGTVAEALAALNVPAVDNEIHHAYTLARRFGLLDLGTVAFGPDEGFVVVEANNQLYVRSGGSGAHFAHHPIGTSTRLAASPDGTQIAFANCGSPCGGSYAPAILDTKTKQVRRFPVGNAHAFYWLKDSASLLFSYDDQQPGQHESSKVCVGRVAGASKRATTVRCLASSVMSEDISAASPSATFIGLQLESRSSPIRVDARGKVLGASPSVGPSPAFVILEMPSGTESYRVAASPILPSMDDRGRVAWDDNLLPQFHMRVRVASRGAPEAVLPNARSVGFFPDGSLLVMPFEQPSQNPQNEPLHTLAEKRCGLFSVWNARGSLEQNDFHD